MSDNPSSEIQQANSIELQASSSSVIRSDLIETDKKLALSLPDSDLLELNSALNPQHTPHPVAVFLLSLKEINIYIAIQSVLDAIDLWLGALKYYYDVLNPLNTKASTNMMYSELKSPIGLLVFLLGGLFFATYAFLGNYYDPKRKDSKLPDFSKHADTSWPFVRDCLKGLKWTFKGTKSVLIVMNLLLKLNYTSLISPLGIIFGIMAASNRFWNRDMVEQRKVLQNTNNRFRENIKYINTCFLEINDPKWIENFEDLSPEHQSCYRGCVIKLSQDLSTIKDEQQLKTNGWLEKYFYVEYDTTKKGYVLKLFYCHSHPLHEFNDEALKGQSIQLSAGYLSRWLSLPPAQRPTYAGKTIISGGDVYYCDEQNQLILFDEKFQFISWMMTKAEPEPHAIAPSEQPKNLTREQMLSLMKYGYQSIQELTIRNFISYEEHLYYINEQGQLEFWKKRDDTYLRLVMQDYQPHKTKISPHEILFFHQRKIDKDTKLDYFHYKTLLKNEVTNDGVLQTILSDKTSFIDEKIKNVSSLKTLYDIPQSQPSRAKAYFSALTSGLLNAPYYFLGILTMASIPENLLVFGVGICTFFMILNVIAELYQEFDFQRRLQISEVKAKLSMIKRCVSLEWDAINEYLVESVHAPSPVEYSLLHIDTYHQQQSGIYGELQAKYDLSFIKLFLTDEQRQAYTSLNDYGSVNHANADALNSLLVDTSIRLNRFKTSFTQQNNIFIDDETILTQFKKAFDLQSPNLSDADRAFLISYVRLRQYHQEYNLLYATLEENVVIPFFPTIMQGIKNGLHVYGMCNGLLITIYSMNAWSFNLSFFIFSIALGLTLVLFATIYTTLYAKPEEKDTPDLEQRFDAVSDTTYTEQLRAFREKNRPEDLKVPYWYDKRNYDHIMANDNAIVPSKNLLISEQCEVFRQFISGFKKGIKFLESIFMLMPWPSSETNIINIILYPIVTLVYGAIFALKGLRGLMRVEPDDYQHSVLVGSYFENPQELSCNRSSSPLQVQIDLDNNDGMQSKEVNSVARALSRSFTPLSFLHYASNSSNNTPHGEEGVLPTPRRLEVS